MLQRSSLIQRAVGVLGAVLVLAVGGCGSSNTSANGFTQDGGIFAPDGSVEGGKNHSSNHSGGASSSVMMLKQQSSSSGGCGLANCDTVHANCGKVSDGCGNLIDCGSCKAPETCGGGGAYRCGIPEGSTCTPMTCKDQGFNCGPQGDGCGGTIATCGKCTGDDTCGGGGKPGVCGTRKVDGGSCVKKTCSGIHANCGVQSDGCGGTLDCGECTAPETCGGGGKPNNCGQACKPKTCANAGSGGTAVNCGTQSDGCGGTIDCGTCTAPLTCGGGGKPSVCGATDGGGGCKKFTCANAGSGGTAVNCGEIGDGCGGTLNCGSCTAPETCGGGGTASVCGSPACMPTTCMALNATCGIQGDGCNGTLDCGTCTSPATCGGGGTPNQCGVSCTPKTCANAGPGGTALNCGPVGDGCGNILECGSCVSPMICGGGSTPQANICGMTVCNPLTCANAGPGGSAITCGSAPDGCGGTVSNCGTCSAPQACGGGGTPNQCGCTGECSGIVTCSGGGTTTITGNVYDPADLHPIYNALVYVPNNPSDPALTTPFPAGVVCDQCGAVGSAAGSPLVTTNTAVDGSFTISNVPVGTSVPVVIQNGRWRSTFVVNVSNSCGANPITTSNTQLVPWLNGTPQGIAGSGHLTFASNSGIGDIPRIAILSGSFDMVECELRKLGLEDSEFVNPSSWGQGNHVQFYAAAQPGARAPGGTGAQIAGGSPSQATLFATGTGPGGAPTINQYDLVILECEGYPAAESGSDVNAVAAYAAAGGRVFASDYAYTWLNSGPLSAAANWGGDNSGCGYGVTANIDPASENPYATPFQAWLAQPTVGVVSGGGTTINIQPAYANSPNVIPPTVEWLYSSTPEYNGCYQGQCFYGPYGYECYYPDPGPDVPTPIPIHMTFNTPIGAPASQQCGLVTYSDWHTQDAVQSQGYTFPNECEVAASGNWSPTSMTDQETILEFMLFNATSCVTPYQATCVSATCTTLGATCGAQGDGCGNIIQCGSCPGTDLCIGGTCTPACTPATCASLLATSGINCGMQGDGCGGTLDCGMCTASGTSCGGGGTPGVCGGIACQPKTCATAGPGGSAVNCGPAGDGCGGELQCGTCATGTTCGGGGPGQCGTGCSPKTCANAGPGGGAATCGPVGDGCGNIISCGTCQTGSTCGGGGVANQCGTGTTCMKQTCASLQIDCGEAGDGCGGTITCGTCTAPSTCGGGGTANVCGTITCTSATCGSLGFNCGPAGDGCGNELQCGNCTAPETCGGGGKGNVCGQPGCTSLTCAGQGFDCGSAGDGCGNLLNCGTCTAPETCGANNHPNVCGTTMCTAQTCNSLGYNCGQAGDGCGGTINCGSCTAPQTCGGGGQANICGSSSGK
jgi:hypothetical protein